MRNNNRILKIVEISFPDITFISNNGEYRKLDLKKLFEELNIQENDFGYEIIIDKNLFNSVEVIDKALAWRKVSQTISLSKGDSFELFFHLDPIQTIENSIIDEEYTKLINYGKSIKSLRKYNLHISQEELGKKIGSDKYYISKIENCKTDLELKTLRKIYEVGLDKNIFIAYYDREDILTSFSNSILNIKFVNWANKRKYDLELIEGIDNNLKKILRKKNIKSTDDLIQLEFKELLETLNRNIDVTTYKFIDSWLTQAKLINKSDWTSVIKLQRTLVNSEKSKIEKLAKKELKEELYAVK